MEKHKENVQGSNTASLTLEGDCPGWRQVRNPGLRQNVRNVACRPQHWKPATIKRYHLRICRLMAQGQSYRMSYISESPTVTVFVSKCIKVFWKIVTKAIRFAFAIVQMEWKQTAEQMMIMIFIIQQHTDNQLLNKCLLHNRCTCNSNHMCNSNIFFQLSSLLWHVSVKYQFILKYEKIMVGSGIKRICSVIEIHHYLCLCKKFVLFPLIKVEIFHWICEKCYQLETINVSNVTTIHLMVNISGLG